MRRFPLLSLLAITIHSLSSAPTLASQPPVLYYLRAASAKRRSMRMQLVLVAAAVPRPHMDALLLLFPCLRGSAICRAWVKRFGLGRFIHQAVSDFRNSFFRISMTEASTIVVCGDEPKRP
eukprot:4420911-Amphidinium_carterae.1